MITTNSCCNNNLEPIKSMCMFKNYFIPIVHKPDNSSSQRLKPKFITYVIQYAYLLLYGIFVHLIAMELLWLRVRRRVVIGTGMSLEGSLVL